MNSKRNKSWVVKSGSSGIEDRGVDGRHRYTLLAVKTNRYRRPLARSEVYLLDHKSTDRSGKPPIDLGEHLLDHKNTDRSGKPPISRKSLDIRMLLFK
jgi:hypothetical protein